MQIMPQSVGHDVIVVGASAGGVEALRSLAMDLPAGLPAAVFVVLHVASEGPGLLGQILDKAGPLQAAVARNGETVEHGRIYVAPPDQHLLVKDGRVRLTRGPRENRARPAIDPLFRSAGIAYSSRVVGVVLTGYLDDGAAGLSAVQRCGGVAVVQDPSDAAFPEMPHSALRTVKPDYVVPVDELGSLLGHLAREPAGPAVPIPRDVAIEAQIAERAMSDIPAEDFLGDQVPLGCPECGGPLWELDDSSVKRYRCHVGHGYTERTLLVDQDLAVERALWAALRTLEERVNMLETLARREAEAGRTSSASGYEARAAESREHIQHLRSVLLDAAA